jgi:cell division protein ZapE
MITISNDVTLDLAQQELVLMLEEFVIQNRSFFDRVFGKKSKHGVYVYGGVGTGKTMIAQAFFDASPEPKLLMHYQDFMRTVHQSIHNLYQGDDMNNVISNIASDYAKRTTLLCLDEFEIHDIADAMIVGRLFIEFVKKKIFILITSNTKPCDLYAKGIQRELFLPFIDFIEDKFHVYCLDMGWDYRNHHSHTTEHILYPLNSETEDKMQTIIRNLTHGEECIPRTLYVFGREVILRRTYQSVLITDFTELVLQNLSYNDYIEICKIFSVIVLEKVPVLGSSDTNEVIRLINLIDNIYFHKNILFASLATSPEELYLGVAKNKEFKRTISRLHEMQSSKYGL